MKRDRILLLTFFSLLSSQFLLAQSNVSYPPYQSGNSGYYNSSYGYYSGASVTGNENVFNGYNAGRYTTGTDGKNNVFVGSSAGYTNTSGMGNIYIGFMAGYYASTADFNTAIGYKSGHYLSSGSNNVFLGGYSGYYTTSGARNVYLGYQAGCFTTGSYNVLIGYTAGYNNVGSNKLYIETSSSSSPLIYGEFDNDLVAINGKLGIGTNSFDNGQLVVDGKIQTEKIHITTDNFPDYVFDEEYHLLPLSEVESFIIDNKHLPGIKPKAEVIAQGMSLSEMNVQLLEKIEELTLHIIELDKKRVYIKTQSEEIQREIETIQRSIISQY